MRKKSAKKSAEFFVSRVEEIEQFLEPNNLSGLSDKHITWAHEYAVIKLYREFEDMILNCLVAAINNDTQELSNKTGVEFPSHLSDEVCEFIVVGDGYFDFRGRDGLIKTLKKFIPDDHYLVTIIKKPGYKDSLERLSALRNFAAHDSRPSKKRALKAVGLQRMHSTGTWLKTQRRFGNLASRLKTLAQEIQDQAPY